MKKILPIFFILTLLFIPLYPVYAEDATTSSSGRKDALKDRLETKKTNAQEKLQNIKDRVASKAATLKNKLRAFRDQRKAKLAEKVNERLSMINKNRTEQMLKRLDRMSEVLTKLEKRIGEVSNKPQVSSVQAAITTAKSDIEKAKAAVEDQSQKDYTIQISSEATVKADAKAARDSLHQDLKAVHELVIKARQSVSSAIKTAATNLGGIKSGQ